MSDLVLALTTLPAGFEAGPLAQDLVGAGLAACINIVPSIRSVYIWDGVPRVDDEQKLLIKTTTDQVDALWEALRARHPYDVPEFVVVPVVDGSEEYFNWVARSVGPKTES